MDVAVQVPVNVEVAAVAEACPVAPVQLAQWSHREADWWARVDADGNRVWSWLLGRSSKAGRQGPTGGGRAIKMDSEDLGDEHDQGAADGE
jgi:hypothetical protein